MGWTLTGASFVHNGAPTRVDVNGNNAAWVCPRPDCGSPILFIYQAGKRGAGPKSPARCRCGASYYLDPPHRSPEPKGPPSQIPATPMTIR